MMHLLWFLAGAVTGVFAMLCAAAIAASILARKVDKDGWFQ